MHIICPWRNTCAHFLVSTYSLEQTLKECASLYHHGLHKSRLCTGDKNQGCVSWRNVQDSSILWVRRDSEITRASLKGSWPVLKRLWPLRFKKPWVRMLIRKVTEWTAHWRMSFFFYLKQNHSVNELVKPFVAEQLQSPSAAAWIESCNTFLQNLVLIQ